MKNQRRNRFGRIMVVALLLSAMSGLSYAAPKKPMDPALAAKREMVRKQQEQQITPEKRKAAVKALRDLRMKVHKARQNSPNRVQDINNSN